ncbi:MAG TPA: M14 family zinc carboxypeptidase [Bacteroidales bacterium]|nr:M14 family zinc carboxypeptidase [Bacteroidales bacterium]
MNKLLTFIAVFFSLLTTAQTSWRVHEMEVRAWPATTTQLDQLHRLHLNGDVYPNGTALLYLTPLELEKVRMLGIPYEILKADLNSWYEGFWDSRESYHTYQEIIDLADSLALHFPGICQKTLHGYSMEGRQLATLKISDNVTVDETEAEVWFDGGIHGDEITGAENLIRFARDLCLGYGNDDEITLLVNSREIWIYLMVNPDGRVHMVRYNANGVDLNRDWGYMWDGWGESTDAYSQQESKVMRDLYFSLQPTIGLSYHSGIELSLYPWGYRYSQANDDAHLSFIAHHYSDMSGYEDLVAEQAVALYPTSGGSIDTYYGSMGSVGLTVELSTQKQPPVSQLMYYYNINYPAMIAMVEQAGYGISGMVTDAQTGEPVQALVYISNYYPSYCDPAVGDFHKFVLPGTYSLEIVANGYESQTIENVVVYENYSAFVEVALSPAESNFAYKVVSVRIPGNNENDEGYTPGILGEPDGINYSMGYNGWIVLEMQQIILDGPGEDFIVYEGDDTPESFSCFASGSPYGPWTLIGEGTGTTSFDLAGGMVQDARYIKLYDGGDTPSAQDNSGFDADALEVLEHPSGTYLALLSVELEDISGNLDGILDPGETASLSVTLRNNGDITAEDIQLTLTTDQLYVSIDTASAILGDLAYGESSSCTFTLTANELTPVGFIFGLALAVEANQGSYENTFGFDFQIGSIGENWETGDMTAFGWVTGGNVPWSVVPYQAYEGTYCVRSGAIANNGVSSLSITMDILADGKISFYRKVSSEPGYDFLEFYVDNLLLGNWSGEAAWEEVSFDVNQGNHVFKWLYTKDQWTVSGSDCAWVDLIRFPPIQSANLGTLSGTVTDMWDGQPIEGASIGGVAVTGSDGLYSLQLSEGVYEICAMADCYDTLCLQTVVMKGQQTVLDFTMLPLPAAYGITGGGEWCEGMEGVAIGLDGSQPECRYELFCNDATTGVVVNGTGEALDFGQFTTLGSYWISATHFEAPCIKLMNGTAEITQAPSPEIPAAPQGPQTVDLYYSNESEYVTEGSQYSDEYAWELIPSEAGVIQVTDDTHIRVTWSMEYLGQAEIRTRGVNVCGESEWSEPVMVTILNTVGFQTISEQFGIKVSPNPSEGIFTIQFKSEREEVISIRIISALNSVAFEENRIAVNGSLTQTIDLSQATDGIYFLYVETGQSTYIRKLVIN